MTNKKTASARHFKTLIGAVLAAEAAKEGTSWTDEAFAAANENHRRACTALSEAIEAAEWGPHGSMFITERSTGIATGRYYKGVWINRRRRATRDDDGYVSAYSAEQAEAEFQAGKEHGRAWKATYETYLEEVGRKLWRAEMYKMPNGHFGISGWEYEEGQEGGYFRSVRKDENGNAVTVSAHGAFRRAAKILRRYGPYRR